VCKQHKKKDELGKSLGGAADSNAMNAAGGILSSLTFSL